MIISFQVIISYLIGSISGSMIIGKMKNVDIRNMGSGNAGGTNAFRTMGIAFSLAVLSIDIFKGFMVAKYMPFVNESSSQSKEIITILCAISTVLGHIYPIFYGFKGGKGAGTMIGILGVLFPSALLVCFIIWIFSLLLTGYVGLSTIIAGIILPTYTSFCHPNGINSPFGYFCLIISLLIIFTHRGNISRMFKGCENRFNKIMIFRKLNS